MKKLLSISLGITTILWLVGTAFVPVAKAAVVEGDIVSPDAAFVDADGNTYYPYDVFIVKIVGTKTFKRLILNPQVFDSYGHLKWSNIKKISAATVKGYTTASLVRAINDTKVYKLAPNGDMGTKQWVETLDCFTSKGYDWDSVYIINATDRDNYTTGSSICGGGATEGPINLSLTSDSPIAATIPPNAQGVTYLKLKVDGTGTINQLTVTRKGAGAVTDFSDIYIYKDGVRIGSGRALSSATSKVTFINLGIGAPATIEVVADMITTNAQVGDVNYFAIESASEVTGTGTVGGVFPINGNPMGVGGTAAGTLTITASGSGSNNVTIGGLGQEISQFKIAATTEGAYVKRVRLFNSGTADNEKITNLKLKDNATAATLATATSISSAGYVDFVLSSPYYIKKGESQIFRVYADIGATKPSYTIILYFELATDILATGNIYGYGMEANVSGFDGAGTTATEGINITCIGGDLTINKIGPNAGKIGTTTSDTVFLEYTVAAAADITIKRTELIFCEDTDGNGTYNDASVSAGADIEDIKIKDKDSGVTIAGPKDGTAFDNNGALGAAAATTAGYQSCPNTKNGVWEAFTDTIDLTAGTTRTFQVTADIKTSNTDSGANGQEIAAASRIKFILYSYASMVGTSGTVNYIKYAGTSDAVDDSAIVPSGNIAGEEMTIESASLAITLAASPSGTDKTYIKGQAGVSAVGIIFTAGSASDVKVNSITLVSATKEASGGAWAEGQDTNYVKDSIGNVYIYDKDTGALVPGSTVKGFSGTTFENVVYTGLSWTIPAGESRTLLVKGDISSAAPASAAPASAATADTWIAFDIDDVEDVSAVDVDGNSVALASADKNNIDALAPYTYFGIAERGSLAVIAATDTPDKAITVMGTTDNEVSKFKLTGTSEGWNIDKFSVVLIDGDTTNYYPDATNGHSENFTAIKLKYQTQTQWGTSNWTISSGKTFGSTASLAFSFSGADKIYVPKDDSSYITVLASIDNYNGGTGAISKVPYRISTISGGADSFVAYGAQSGYYQIDFTEPSASGFNLMFTARSKPVFAKSAWSGGELELVRFTITAVGYDVIFTGEANTSYANVTKGQYGSASLQFDVIASSIDAASIGLTLYDWNENIVSSVSGFYSPDAGSADGFDGTAASASFIFEVKDTTVPKDTTKEFHIDLAGADLTDFSRTDEYIYLQLKNDDGGNTATGGASYFDYNSAATTSFDVGYYNIVYHDGTAAEGISANGDPQLRFGMPSLIKNIGPLPITFRTLRGTIAH